MSVVMPAYGTSAYIAESLESVFTQSFTDFEVVVVNDGAPDTRELEQAIAPWADRIVYVKQSNRGVSAARNAGIAASGGELIAFLDSDDAWLPDFLGFQVGTLDEDPGLDLRWTDAFLFGDAAPARRFSSLNEFRRPVTAASLIEIHSCPVTSAVVARRDAIERVGGFDERVRHAEDYDLFVRMAIAGCRLDCTADLLVRHRVRSTSLSADIRSHYTDWRSVLRETIVPLTYSQPEAGAAALRTLRMLDAWFHHDEGSTALKAGRNQDALAAFRKANEVLPTWERRVLITSLAFSPRLTMAIQSLNRLRVRYFRLGYKRV